jgi:rare lipoprotein A (peptidoglycan hydrolase)
MLALHKTAPLGSLILVKNKATGRQVTAKVIGKLPDTGNNENVLIRLSPAAFYKLNPKDIRISAEVTYYLPPSPM